MVNLSILRKAIRACRDERDILIQESTLEDGSVLPEVEAIVARINVRIDDLQGQIDRAALADGGGGAP